MRPATDPARQSVPRRKLSGLPIHVMTLKALLRYHFSPFDLAGSHFRSIDSGLSKLAPRPVFAGTRSPQQISQHGLRNI
jgi:hypothetical protein